MMMSYADLSKLGEILENSKLWSKDSDEYAGVRFRCIAKSFMQVDSFRQSDKTGKLCRASLGLTSCVCSPESQWVWDFFGRWLWCLTVIRPDKAADTTCASVLATRAVASESDYSASVDKPIIFNISDFDDGRLKSLKCDGVPWQCGFEVAY